MFCPKHYTIHTNIKNDRPFNDKAGGGRKKSNTEPEDINTKVENIITRNQDITKCSENPTHQYIGTPSQHLCYQT